MLDIDQLIPGSAWFRWREAIYLHEWDIYACPSPDVFKNIIFTAKNIADPIRSLLGKPVQIVSWFRPPAYNKAIGGALDSQHMRGLAIDFKVITMEPEAVRSLLKPRLESMNIRMELNTPTWTHCDGKIIKPGESRTFLP